jgi:hypothetical protein
MKGGEMAVATVAGLWLLRWIVAQPGPEPPAKTVEGESVWKGGKKFQSRVGKVRSPLLAFLACPRVV